MGREGRGERRGSDAGYILTVELIGLANTLDVECEKKTGTKHTPKHEMTATVPRITFKPNIVQWKKRLSLVFLS